MSPRAHTVYLRITYDCHSKPTCPSLYSIPRLVFIMEAQCVLCKVPTNPLKIVQTLNWIRTPPHTTTKVSKGVCIQPICTEHSGQSLWGRRHNCPASGSFVFRHRLYRQAINRLQAAMNYVTFRWIDTTESSGHYRYHHVLYGSQNKQRLYPFTTLNGFYNRDGVCLLRGTDWVFIHNWGWIRSSHRLWYINRLRHIKNVISTMLSCVTPSCFVFLINNVLIIRPHTTIQI
jgi:hypothetical protein